MLIKRYADASCEVLNILNHMNDDDLSKVSYKFIDFLKKNASCDYIPNLDFSKSLSDMNLKEETKALLTIMYKKYWCTDEDKRLLQKRLYLNEQVYQKELREKYNPDNIFANSNNVKKEEKQQEEIHKDDNGIFGKIKTFVKNVWTV